MGNGAQNSTDLTLGEDATDLSSSAVPRPTGPLPASLVLNQRCAGAVRAYLNANGLRHYRVFCAGDGDEDDLADVDAYLDRLDEPAAAWQMPPPLVAGGERVGVIAEEAGADAGGLRESGILRLARHEVVLARWYWVHVEDGGTMRSLLLSAAPSAAAFARFRAQLSHLRRTGSRASWQIVRGYAYADLPKVPRVAPADLLLDDDVRRRVDGEIVRFFTPEVERLYASLNVPYRRGVLLHGPPGNGKTSLIRHVGARLPHVPAMLLRPSASFDADKLEQALRRWMLQAPAILVIEDLNWLLEQVNISTFLNQLDGADASVTGGLLLIATTNHPEVLDPAINNRPGRFDVALEIPCPRRDLRLALLRQKLAAQIDDAIIERVAGETDGLSFAHLQEVLRLSGLTAIHAGRNARCDADVLEAVRTVRRAHEEAIRGFPSRRPEIPFGLLPLRERRKSL